MANMQTLFYSDSLIKFVKSVKINQEQKKVLLSKIPNMGPEERGRLFKTLTEVYLLDREESKRIERIKRFLEK